VRIRPRHGCPARIFALGSHGAGDAADSFDFGLLRSFWGAKFPKIGDTLPWTPMNRCAKFDADSFILGGEIRNRTNKQTNKQTNKITNSNRYIHTLPIGMCG